MTGIDRELLRDLDRHLRGPQIDTPPTAPEAHMALPARADISGVLEAIQFAASSMNATAEHIEQLEAHSKAFDAANQELERPEPPAQRCSSGKRYRSVMRLQQALKPRRSARSVSRDLAAQHVSRANAFERELAASQADLAKVTELVRSTFGTPPEAAPSSRPEDPMPKLAASSRP